ncbi:GTP-binding protein [Metabacillus idriensis]|uniref:GTPase domain-containing protein n=1 Tax=Metabacillus idriensis TaxID=324768 RepID=UPI0028145370|nr:GTP-binding protein [Metabacillus idriensis]MDR0139298.1 GTP-binding protein [Metabacillus idriensis]
MTNDKQLIHKAYFERFMEDSASAQPVQVLGELYFEEQAKEVYDLSFIRFAQGEVYFHNKDYETAIFKWENISNELEPWAKKNIADSYYALGLLSAAEDIYTSIQSDSKTLKMEVALELFSLYLVRDKIELAYKVIKKALDINSDYPNVTDLARSFYEDQQDWKNAVELAVSEGMRTESLQWFELLDEYVQAGYTKSFDPEYFYQPLISLFRINQKLFQKVTASLWESYRHEDSYLSWLKTVNTIFLNVEVQPFESWTKMSDIHQNTYLSVINGTYLVKDLEDIVPVLLSNWQKLANQSKALFAATAVLAWNEIFPSSMDAESLKTAEKLIFDSEHDSISLEYSLDLFKSLVSWAENNHIEVGYKKKWLVSGLADLKTSHLLISGTAESGKSDFINHILHENLVSRTGSPVFVRSEGDLAEMNEITDAGIKRISDNPEYQESENTWIEVKWPSALLEENKTVFLHTPELERLGDVEQTAEFLPISDGMLFVLDKNTPFNEHELELLMKLQEYAVDTPFHFILNHSSEQWKLAEELQGTINQFFPQSQVFAFSPDHLAGLREFLNTVFSRSDAKLEEKRTAKLLYFIRKTLTDLLNKRVQMENRLVESVKWNEDILVRLNGFMNHLRDVEQEKAKTISASYREVTAEMKRDMAVQLPKILRSCSAHISENSDFSQIHITLNKKMNEEIDAYVHQNLIPKFQTALREWLAQSNEELNESQAYLDEMSLSFNGLYGEEKMKLLCDFKIIEDWRRDLNRMTSRADVDEQNILLRFKPTEFLLKSAGKLFAAMPQNKSMLYNQYKKYVESKNYEDTAEDISKKFFLEFDLFEKALKADIIMFFQNPILYVEQTIKESENEIASSKATLEKMKASPEIYYDPLRLFEVRLLQYEFMVKANEENTYSHNLNK